MFMGCRTDELTTMPCGDMNTHLADTAANDLYVV